MDQNKLSNYLLIFCFWILFLFPFRLFADASLELKVSSLPEQVLVSVKNTGQLPVPNIDVVLELDGQHYTEHLAEIVRPGQELNSSVKVVVPQNRGSYPIIAKVSYDFEGVRRSLAHVGLFNIGGALAMSQSVALRDVAIRREVVVELALPTDGTVRLVVPDALEARPIDAPQGTIRYLLTNRHTQFSSDYSIFAVVENYPGGTIHQTSISSAKVVSRAVVMDRSRFSLSSLGAICLVTLLICALSYIRYVRGRSSAAIIALARWSFSLFVISALFLFMRTAYVLPNEILAHRHLGWGLANLGHPYLALLVTSLFERLYFDGIDYDYFNRFVADPLLLYFVFLNFAVLYWIIKPDPKLDKNWHLMQSVLSLVPGVRRFIPGGSFYFSKQSKVALLALLVKAFYVPIMCSWAINNIIHQSNLTQNLQFSFRSINEYLVALLIFIDVAIFCLGYLVELPQFKNQIKTVEPTLLGWAVCLMCYPPFNQFSMKPFDYKLFAEWGPFSDSVQVCGLVVITLLWAVYAWASVALGWKASNLTNRGIVSTGPYRFVRHPAYVSKVMLWGVGGLCLANMSFWLFVATAIIYGLRAWTEERHLIADPDYVAYKAKVRWVIIPGIY